MAPGIFERIQAKIELFRLEQRYTRRRNRRSTFVSNAIYVDGEYIYNTPNTTGSSTNSSSTSQSTSYNNNNTTTTTTASSSRAYTTDNMPSSSPQAEKAGKKLNRYSSMPGFGSLSKVSGGRRTAEEWRTGNNVDVSEMR